MQWIKTGWEIAGVQLCGWMELGERNCSKFSPPFLRQVSSFISQLQPGACQRRSICSSKLCLLRVWFTVCRLGGFNMGFGFVKSVVWAIDYPYLFVSLQKINVVNVFLRQLDRAHGINQCLGLISVLTTNLNWLWMVPCLHVAALVFRKWNNKSFSVGEKVWCPHLHLWITWCHFGVNYIRAGRVSLSGLLWQGL